MTEAIQSSGLITSTFMIGSSSTDLALWSASRNAARAATSNANAESDVMIAAIDQIDLHVDHRKPATTKSHDYCFDDHSSAICECRQARLSDATH